MPYKNKENKEVYDRRYYKKNKEKINKVNKKYAQSEKGKLGKRKDALKRKFGISLKEYDEIFAKQNGICVICGQTEINRRLAVDHNHKTDKIRGLLCTRCNFWVGQMEKNPNLISQIMEYIKNYE